VLTWFVHPLLFIIATLWTLGMLLRRQFLSHTFRAIARRTAVLYGEAPHRRP
jgi:uncharacterized membrane protein